MPQSRLSKYRRQPEQLKSKTHALEITPRSLEIIELIGRYKFLPTSLIKGLTPGDRSNIARHLQALFHKGYVNKFCFPRIGNPGESIYYLDSRRALDLLVSSGRDKDSLDWDGVARNAQKPYHRISFGEDIDDLQGTLMFLHHEVMLSRFRATLELACRESHQVELAEWQQGSVLWNKVDVPKLQYKGLDENSEPIWYELQSTERIPHRPDAFFTLRFPKEDRDDLHFLYEADRKHTSAPKHNRKLRGHFAFIVKQKKHLGAYKQWGVKRIRAVLIETLDTGSADRLRNASMDASVSGRAKGSGGRLMPEPSALFWFTSSTFLTKSVEMKRTVKGEEKSYTAPTYLAKPKIIFSNIWAPASEDKLMTLLD
jgi:hypothetical protein